MPSLGAPEIIILLVIALLVVGPKKLPSVGRSVGTGIREFKDAIMPGDGEKDRAEVGS
jgi:sec-independent protein translocase protein TatA